jgi:LPS export ABC transporter protein LptC
MNINFFLVLIFSGLGLIYVLFKPMDLKQQEFKDVPLFKINDFTLYELNTKELFTLMKGSQAIRYADRYDVNTINYTDSSKDYIANMLANNGIYKNEIVTLKGDVVYTREDGLTFETQTLLYNKSKATAYAENAFVAYKDQDRVTGTTLQYNNIKNSASAKHVKALYNLEEGK